MKKISVLVLLSIGLPIIGKTGELALGIDTAIHYSHKIANPVIRFFEKIGANHEMKDEMKKTMEELGNKIAEETSVSNIINAAEINKSDLFGSTVNPQETAQELMSLSLQKGLAARFFNFKEGQPLPSLSAISLPFVAGKTVSIAISFIPGAGELGKFASNCVGRTLQFALRDLLDYKGADYDVMTLTTIHTLAQEVANEYAQHYKSVLSKMTPQELNDFVHYGSISILDSMDEILLRAKDGDTLTVKEIIDKMSNRYLKIDHGVPTLKTIAKKIAKNQTRKKGFGARTVGNIMTTPLINQGDQLYFDNSSLDQDRIDNMKKRGHLKENRKLKSLEYIREAEPTETLDPTRYKAITLEEAEKIMKEQNPTRIQRITGKAKKTK